jgi:hypothetical protein
MHKSLTNSVRPLTLDNVSSAVFPRFKAFDYLNVITNPTLLSSSCRDELQLILILHSSIHCSRCHHFNFDILRQCSGCRCSCPSVPLSLPR